MFPEICFLKFVARGNSCALNIRVIVWKNDATVQTQIILYCFKTMQSEYCATRPRTMKQQL